MRRNTAKAKDYAHRHNVGKWYEDADALIKDPEIHSLYGAISPDTSHDYTIKALNSGKPVYVEKPMALNYRVCQEMIRVAGKNELPLFVNVHQTDMAYSGQTVS